MAERLGLHREKRDTVTRLSGRRGAFTVQITVTLRRHGESRIRFEQQIEVRAEKTLSPAPVLIEPRAERQRGLRTGDASFDAEMLAIGPRDVVFALLSSSVRSIVMGHGGHWRLDGKTVQWRAQRAPNLLSATTEQILSLAESLQSAKADLVEGLGARIRHDPIPEVRRRALSVALTAYPDEPRTTEWTRAALKDPFPRLRLDAATALGPRGRPTLLTLLGHRSTPRRVRVLAAARFAPGDADAQLALRRLYDAGGPELRVMALSLLGRIGGRESLAFLEPLTRALSVGSRIRRAAHSARGQILERCEGVGRGQLSVVGSPEAGALSPSREKGEG